MDYKYKIASRADDKGIRKLLSDNPMPGFIKISYERNPSFFASLSIQGYNNRTFVVKDKRGNVIGLAVRSLQHLYINGHKSKVGYLSNLRVDRNFRRKGILRNGMKIFKSMNKEDKLSFYYSTFIRGNVLAQKIFLKKRIDFPSFYDAGVLNTYIIPVGQAFNVHRKINLEKAILKDRKRIVNFINKCGKLKNFFPYLDVNFDSNMPLGINNFFIAFKNKEIVGALCLWDQSGYKQNIVKGFSFPLNFIIPLYNFYCKWMKKKAIPGVNQPFNSLFVSYVAIKNNDPDDFNLIIKQLLNKYKESKYHFFILGLHKNDALNNALKGIKSIKYLSNLYIVSWDDNYLDKVYKLAQKPIYVEVARL